MNKLNNTGPSIDLFGTALATGFQLHVDCATNGNLLSSAVQPVLNLPHHPLLQPTFPELVY